MKGYPTWFFVTLLAALTFEGISGLMLIPTTLDMKFAIDVPWRMMGELQLNTIMVHSFSAYLLMSFIGALGPVHMRSGIRQKKHLLHGLTLLSLFICLMLSALGLLYFADEDWINTAAMVHLTTGLAVIFIFVIHYAHAQKKKDAKNPESKRVNR